MVNLWEISPWSCIISLNTSIGGDLWSTMIWFYIEERSIRFLVITFNGHYEICSLNLKKTEYVFVHESELQKV